jgi:hypothetical protein
MAPSSSAKSLPGSPVASGHENAKHYLRGKGLWTNSHNYEKLEQWELDTKHRVTGEVLFILGSWCYVPQDSDHKFLLSLGSECVRVEQAPITQR